MTNEQELFDAYRHTDFCAETPLGRIVIHVGHTNATLNALLRQAGHATWAYLTAFNPGSVQLSKSENEARQHDLVAALRERGHPLYHGEGIGCDKSWPPEPSILVLGIECGDAIALGGRFGQLAIVWGELGGPASLMGCQS